MRRTFAIPEDRTVIEMTEIVSAPRERVWVARTEPLYIAQWWMPVGYSNPIVEVDLVEGGTWRIVQRDPDGREFSFYGKFLTIEPHRYVVQTFVSELFPEVTIHITSHYKDHPRGTEVSTVYAFESDVQRRGYIRLGGVERMAEASALFDRLLAKLAQAR